MTDLCERRRTQLPQERTTLDRVDAWWRAANHIAGGLPGEALQRWRRPRSPTHTSIA